MPLTAAFEPPPFSTTPTSSSRSFCARFSAYGIAAHLGRVLVYRSAVRARHFFEKIRFVQRAAVDRRAHSAYELHGSDRYRLPETYAREIDVLDAALAHHYAAAFAEKVYARLAAEPEGFQRIVKAFRTQRQREIHEHDVAAVAHAFGKRLRTVAYRTPAAYALAVHRPAPLQ